VLNGAWRPSSARRFGLTPAQKGVMLSVPILAGALMRFPAGRAGAVHRPQERHAGGDELIAAALAFGFFAVDTFTTVLAMGVLLGIAGASFGVALSLGSGWFPAQVQGPGHGHWAPATWAPCWPCCSRRRWHRSSAGRPCTASPPPPCCCPCW
jgi:NNP family nitrate/nitrite transporter-like MFS transporter